MKIFKFLKNFVGLDGVLHFLACAVIMFTVFSLLDNIRNAVIITTVIAVYKELFAVLIERVNTLKQALKDVIFDAFGIVYAILFLVYLY